MNFWDQHGFLFLLSMLVFPRLTFLFGVGIPFSIFSWIGWAFLPRFVAAYYGTLFYWDQNPLLCSLSWIAAFATLGGEGGAARR